MDGDHGISAPTATTTLPARQFNLRWMFIVSFDVAVGFGLFRGESVRFLDVLILMSIPLTLWTLALFTQEFTRVIAIALLIPAALFLAVIAADAFYSGLTRGLSVTTSRLVADLMFLPGLYSIGHLCGFVALGVAAWRARRRVLGVLILAALAAITALLVLLS